MAKTILTTYQTLLLGEIAKDKNFSRYFYFTGGTVLSEFYLHHRLSEDLDFFSQQEIDKAWLTSLVTKLTRVLPIKSIDRRTLFNRNLIFFTFSTEKVKTEFTFFPSPQIEKPKRLNGLPVDSEMDIAVNKFFTIYQNPSARHFIDLYLLITRKKYDWEQLQKLARIKFDTNIDPIQLGSQLVKAQDIQDLPTILIKLPEDQWRSYFLEKARNLREKVAKRPQTRA